MLYLISPNKKQYKANLHSHTTFSDGKKTPQELKEMYKRKGYSILAITDHEVPKSHCDLNDEEFIAITGYENYIRQTETGRSNIYLSEIHMNLFARQPDNETMICYDKRYCKYLSDNEQNVLKKAGSERPREYSIEYINEFIQTAKENGYLVAYNHPYWSMESEADVLAYEGYFSMEMCNYASHVTNHLEYNAALYDKMLCAGKRVFCHGADDNHNDLPIEDPMSDSFGAFTMIIPEQFTYDGIINAMEQGEMYASMGPLFKEVSVDGDVIHIECSEVAEIHVYFGSKQPESVRAEEGQVLTGADIRIDPRAKYVRVSIFDTQGRAADTRGFFRDEIGMND